MNSFRAKLVTTVLAYGFVIGAAVGAILYYGFREHFTNWYFGILAFFLIIEPLLLLFVEQSSRSATARGLVNTYMLTKVIKTVATLGCIAIYALVVKENVKSFALTFMILYILFTVVETMLFMRIEKRLKEKQQQ